MPTLKPLYLALLLAASPAFAQQNIDKVNGAIEVSAGQVAGKLETVNGAISIGENARTGSAETVNGAIRVGNGAQVGSLEAVNGSITLGERVRSGSLETVNGSIRVAANGETCSIETVNGNITIGIDSHVRGKLKIEKSRGGSFMGISGKQRPPRIIIGPNAVVEGPLVFEREVKLYVHSSAKTGAITGATAQRFDTPTPPND